jgi:hypothetical protein
VLRIVLATVARPCRRRYFPRGNGVTGSRRAPPLGPGAKRWADLPEDERRRRQSQSDGARAAAAHEAALPEDQRRQRQVQRDADRVEARRVERPVRGTAAEVTELESGETLRAMWNTVENGGYDFMTKGGW